MRKTKTKDLDNVFFWETARRFLDYELLKIRKKSLNTVAAYRVSLNICIEYLENVKGIRRENICFSDLGKENLKEYLMWMAEDKKWSPKTCNLRMTAIRSLLSYASEECIDITPLSASSKAIQSLSAPAGELEYFEDYQMEAILNALGTEKQSERRNKMLLILGYDAAMRIGEMTKLKVGNLFLDAEKPYIRILGKVEKYRSVPLMGKTVQHLRRYVRK